MMRNKTEQVLGSELKPGDIIWSQGYKRRVIATYHGEGNQPKVSRWCVDAEWIDDGDSRDPGVGYRRFWHGLRDDLKWTREIQP